MAVKRAAFVLVTTGIVAILLLPLAYGVTTSLKTENQLSATNAPVLPSSPQTLAAGGSSYDV